MTVVAEDMAAMRLQAKALAFQWFSARDYTASSDGYAFFLLRPSDFGLRDDVMGALRIRVALSFERDDSTPTPAPQGQSGEPVALPDADACVVALLGTERRPMLGSGWPLGTEFYTAATLAAAIEQARREAAEEMKLLAIDQVAFYGGPVGLEAAIRSLPTPGAEK